MILQWPKKEKRLISKVKIEDYRKTHTTEWLSKGHDVPDGMEQPTVAPVPPEDDPEEKRIAKLAARARNGDYDDGMKEPARIDGPLHADSSRAHPRATRPQSRLPC